MIKLFSFSLLFILILLVSSHADSQSKNSATQTVTFAVNRSKQYTLQTLANSSDLNMISKSSELTALRSSLEKKSMKVTIAEVSTHSVSASSKISNVHIDVKSVVQKGKPAIDRISTVVTVTE